MLNEVRPLADVIAVHDRDHARQLGRSALSVVLNMAETRLRPIGEMWTHRDRWRGGIRWASGLEKER